jgi:hypothetical protein
MRSKRTCASKSFKASALSASGKGLPPPERFSVYCGYCGYTALELASLGPQFTVDGVSIVNGGWDTGRLGSTLYGETG